MTNDEKDLLAPLIYWSNRVEESAEKLGDANLDMRLPAAAGRQLRNLAEAVSACEQTIQSLVYRRDPSEEVLRQIAGRLRMIARRIDDVTLPATIQD